MAKINFKLTKEKKEQSLLFKFPKNKEKEQSLLFMFSTKVKKTALFEIATLIIATFAFAFLVASATEPVSALENPLENFAEQIQQYTGTEDDSLGCCIDKEGGSCTPNSLKTECEANKGIWKDDAFCNINECRTGCCIFGLNAQPSTTQAECENIGNLYGVPIEWDASTQEASQCLDKLDMQETGACVFPIQYEDKNNCRFSTMQECQSVGGDFHKNYLCSNSELNTVCEKQNRIGTFSGAEEIYWFDSCGNRENIYSSNKAQSWNNGKVLSEAQSCNPNSANSKSSTCGNCNYELGSIGGEYRAGVDTKLKDGEYTCRDLNCKSAPYMVNSFGKVLKTKDRINGESWCVYDSNIGNVDIGFSSIFKFNLPVGILSADVVGSRHWRYSCVNGKVEVEGCADYRKEICVQNEKTLSNGKKVDNAFCRVNMWEQCIGYNGQKGCEAGCLAQCALNPDCRVHPVFVSPDFKFNACVPNYPAGFDLGSTSGAIGLAGSTLSSQISQQLGQFGDIASQASGMLGGGTDASQVCGLASQTCTVVFKKVCPGGWKCVKNCQCMKASFTAQMNNLCASVGDCGVYVNIAGRPTFLGASVSKKGSLGHKPPPPALLAPLYIIFAKAVIGKHVPAKIYDSVDAISRLPLGIADLFLSGMFGEGYARTKPKVGSQFENMGGWNDIASAVISPFVLAVFTNIWTPWGLIGSLLILALKYLFGCGKTKKVEITFNCKPWQRPFIGDCENCNDGGELKPCTKYRCESLGMNCQIINEGTGFDKCISLKVEDKIPTITPFEEILNKNLYKYTDVSNNGFRVRAKDGECVNAFEPIIFGVETDVYANCKISTDRTFGEVEEWTAEDENSENYEGEDLGISAEFFENIGGVFTKNHTYATYLPSVESIIASETGSPEEFAQLINNKTLYDYILDKVGDLDFYVKCMNLNGQENDHDFKINFCVKPGPDLTPPVITATAPANNNLTMFNATEQQMWLFVNEPADCKWDVIMPIGNSLVNYNSLGNSMECNTDVAFGTLMGYACNTTLPITQNENKFYFLCRDQPWLGDANESRNIGNIFEYTLRKTENALVIDSISPNETITAGAEPITLTLKAETSGGVENGKAWCEYSMNEGEFYDRFAETGTNVHRQIFTSIIRGNYNVKVNCIDSVGNTAQGETSFTLELDTEIPQVARVYNDFGSLMIITNEDATCSYATDSKIGCGFNLNNASLMESEGIYQSTIWVPNLIHYIKCKDIYGNYPTSCSIIVKPYESYGPSYIQEETSENENSEES